MILAHVAPFLSYSGMPTPPRSEAGQPNPTLPLSNNPFAMQDATFSMECTTLRKQFCMVEVEQALSLSRDGKVQSVFAFFKGKAQV